MANPKSIKSARLDSLQDLIATIGDCQTITSEIASDTWGGNTELTLQMVSRVLCEAADKLDDMHRTMRDEAGESAA